MNKAPKVFRAVANIRCPDDIPFDVDTIDYLLERHIRNRTIPDGCGLKTPKSLAEFRYRHRSFVAVANGAREATEALGQREDDWAELDAHLSGKRGAPIVLDKTGMISFGTLARVCRQLNLSPTDLSDRSSYETLLAGVNPGDGHQIRHALRHLVALKGSNRVPASLLPDISSDLIDRICCSTIRQVPELHPDLSSLMAEYLWREQCGKKTAYFGSNSRTVETGGVGRARVKNLKVAIRWFWHGATLLGACKADGVLVRERLTDPVLLNDIVEACSRGDLGTACSPDTRRAYLMMAIGFLDWLEPGYRNRLDKTVFEARCLRKKKGTEARDEKRKRGTCLDFISDQRFQVRFYGMPARLFEKAKQAIANFESLRPSGCTVVSRDEHHALDLAIMAALTAIITRFPARLETLSQLVSGGYEPHILFPREGKFSDAVVLDIPGYIVKNGRYASGIPLLPSETGNPREILDWYLDVAHPLVLKYKHVKAKCRRPDLLFTGLNINTLRRIWNRHAVDQGVPVTPHMSRHLIASHLYSLCSPVEDIAALLNISPGVVENSYAFFDRVLAVQGVMKNHDEIYRNLEI